MAEFDNPDGLVKRLRKAHAAGYRHMDAYTPYPIEEAADAIGFEKTRVPLLTPDGRHSGRAQRIPAAVLD